MSLRQNMLFGISGNLEKLVFPKILPADANIRNGDVFYFRNPIFLQNFAKFLKIPQILLQIAKTFKKTNSSNFGWRRIWIGLGGLGACHYGGEIIGGTLTNIELIIIILLI